MSIFVTGIGAISSIGNNVEENYRSLVSERSGLNIIKGLKGMRREFIGGEVSLSDVELKNSLAIDPSMDVHRSTLLGSIAAKEAWGERTVQKNIRTAVIFGTTIGGVDIGSDLMTKLVVSDKNNKIDFMSIHNEGFGTGFIARSLNIHSHKFTLSTACSTSANSILLGARLIKAGLIDRALVGGAEAITNYTLNGFDSLSLYDDQKCKPFDENRKGLNLGEGSGFLVLENECSLELSSAKPIACLSGWANTCDAYHITASSPDGKGAVLCMLEALKMAKLEPDQIDHINMHGTGTNNNDLSESYAIQTVFGNNTPPFSSTKSYIGHTLAAAGGIEAVYSILALKHKVIFPNLNHSVQMKEFQFKPNTHLISAPGIKHVMSNSFGFGGNCSELIFSA